MRKFVIETGQNYIEVMKKILSDCDVSGTLDAEIREYLDGIKDRKKTYNCHVANNKLFVKMKMPYRNSFASEMTLEILINENKTRINGYISSIMSNGLLKKMFLGAALIFSAAVLFLIITENYGNFQLFHFVIIAIALILLFSVLPHLLSGRTKKDQDFLNEPYGVQMGHWISNLFPGEVKVLEK